MAFSISKKSAFSRKKSPSELSPEGILNIPQRSKYRRQLETLLACAEIHGGSADNREPALDGMCSTLEKYGTDEKLKQYSQSSKKFQKANKDLVKTAIKKFEKSDDNNIRSCALLYAGGVTSKRKYESTRSILSTSSTGNKTEKGFLKRKRIQVGFGYTIPKILPYKNLMSVINNINIGDLYSVNEMLCKDMPSNRKVNGVYRDLEDLLTSLAEYYLTIDVHRIQEDRLKWFGEKKGSFKVAIGGDGAPFGKWDQSMSWLVSFLNVGPRVASPNDNFLLFGANCSETHDAVIKYTKMLGVQCSDIEKKTYSVCGINVTFTFDLIPTDMKFLAFVNGELSNSSRYFSSFANASTDDLDCLHGSFGITDDKKWKPWKYSERLVMADKVSKLKTSLSKKKYAASTHRNKVTQFIGEKKSRQEFKPPIGKLCDKGVLEPLHLKNNAVQKLHSYMLELALSTSNLPSKVSLSGDLPECSITRFINALEHKVKAKRLKTQVLKWLVEDRSKDKNFSYRFTGKDSQLILHGFMYLIDAIRGKSSSPALIAKLLTLVFIALRLRDSVSLFSMYHFSQEKLLKLQSDASDYFTALVLFQGTKPSPSEWSIGKLVSVHAQWMLDKYGTGLGINTMQGREAKHVQIASYAKQTNYNLRWYQVFRHDYISKVWLPLQNPSILQYHQTNDSVVPDRIHSDKQKVCYCGFEKSPDDSKCFYCNHELMGEIYSSVENKKNSKKLLKLVGGITKE